jgi:PilZ domain
MDSNRRIHSRKELHLAVEIITEDNVYTGITDDISKGGMAIEIDGPVYDQQNVQVGVFKIVEGIEDSIAPTGINGKIVWARIMKPGIFSAGIRFINLGAEEESYLAELVGEANKLF